MEDERIFKPGQLVYCIYHWGWFFRPPAPGRVLFRWPIKHRHLFANGFNGLCAWYFVLTRGFIPVVIPSTCMYDLEEHIRSTEQFVKLPIDCGEHYAPEERERRNRNEEAARLRLIERSKEAKEWMQQQTK